MHFPHILLTSLFWFMASPILLVGQIWNFRQLLFLSPMNLTSNKWQSLGGLFSAVSFAFISTFLLPSPLTPHFKPLFLFAWAKTGPQLFISFSFSSSYSSSRWIIPNQSTHHAISYADRLSGISFCELLFFFLKRNVQPDLQGFPDYALNCLFQPHLLLPFLSFAFKLNWTPPCSTNLCSAVFHFSPFCSGHFFFLECCYLHPSLL